MAALLEHTERSQDWKRLLTPNPVFCHHSHLFLISKLPPRFLAPPLWQGGWFLGSSDSCTRQASVGQGFRQDTYMSKSMPIKEQMQDC